MADTARYLYAVSRGLPPAALADGVGLRDGVLEVVSHRGLDAVVSDVPLPEFGEEGLRGNLEKLPWLEEVARTHDEVVRDVVATGSPTAPLRLATIFLDDAAVRQRVDEWHQALVDALDRVEGALEWSVKVVAPPKSNVGEPEARPASGAEFLRQRKARLDHTSEQDQAATKVAESVHDLLTRMSSAERVLQPQDPQLAGHAGTMVLNGAYLVPRDQEEMFAAAVEEFRALYREVIIELAGPWPPYSFAVLDES